jgi:hypothetical protein
MSAVHPDFSSGEGHQRDVKSESRLGRHRRRPAARRIVAAQPRQGDWGAAFARESRVGALANPKRRAAVFSIRLVCILSPVIAAASHHNDAPRPGAMIADTSANVA